MSPRRQKGIPGLYGGDARGLYGSRSYGQRGTMIYGKQPNPRWPKLLIGLLIAIIVVLCIKQFACGGLFPQAQESQQQDQAQEQVQEQAAEEQAQDQAQTASATAANGSITITAIGDCTLGIDPDFETDTSFESIYSKNNASYFFKRVTKYTANDDLTIANLEGALTESTTPEDKGENSYNFRGPTSYTSILKKGSVEACNLANNHSFDYGSDGYQDTKNALKKAKIDYFCADLTCVKEINGVKVGMFGINATAGYDEATTMTKKDIKALEDENCDLLIGVFHWGTEGSYDVDTDQVKLAHAAIDAGADLVLGGHPHLVQGVELYKNRYIVYSLGNFVFGGNDDPMDYSTMMYQQTFTFENGNLAVDSQLSSAKIIPCRVSTSKTVNNYQPIPVGGNEGASIIKKINSSSKKLSGDGALFSTKLDDNLVSKVEQ